LLPLHLLRRRMQQLECNDCQHDAYLETRKTRPRIEQTREHQRDNDQHRPKRSELNFTAHRARIYRTSCRLRSRPPQVKLLQILSGDISTRVQAPLPEIRFGTVSTIPERGYIERGAGSAPSNTIAQRNLTPRGVT
jgi:hypothetical protein